MRFRVFNRFDSEEDDKEENKEKINTEEINKESLQEEKVREDKTTDQNKVLLGRLKKADNFEYYYFAVCNCWIYCRNNQQ